MSQSNARGSRKLPDLLVLVILEFVVLVGLFGGGFLPDHTLFSNDGPLGAITAECRRFPGMFSGAWMDLNTLGYREGGAPPSITYPLQWLLGPLWFSRVYAPFALLFLGLCAWTFFRQLGLSPVACCLGGLAATLNSTFLGVACWGLAGHPITIALSYLAMAALVENSSRPWWLRVPLAGLAVGLGVVEGADIGAIFSVYVAIFAIYQAWVSDHDHLKSLMLGVSRVVLVAVFAVFIAAHSLAVLIATQIVGVAGTKQDRDTKQQHWDFATQWSLPKREALGFAVPGLFGYRMDTPDGGNYWGAVGRDPNWDRYFANGKQGPPPQGTIRFSGGGVYAGILVLLIGAWTVCQSLRKKDSVFTLATRKWVWFWGGVFVVSLLFAFGRFAPFYQFLYALPYFSTIRNPAKFTYPCSFALVVLFAYGVNGLWRLYMEPQQNAKLSSVRESFGGWWQRVRGFDRRWTIGCAIALGVAALGWLIFASSSDAFEKYLQEVQLDPTTAHAIAKFSVGQLGLFVVFFAVAILLMVLVMSGRFRGPYARWGAILLGAFLLVDMGRANEPWVVVWNYAEKYASNPVIDFLRKQPYLHRVAVLPRWILQVFQVPPKLVEEDQFLRQLYGIEWTQHHFLYYNIQSLDVIQMPRMPEDLAAYESRLFPQKSDELTRVTRHWQLTNTRYVVGPAAFLDLLNHQFDPVQHRFRIAERFNIVLKPDITRFTKLEELTAVQDTNGPFAVFEFTGVLPRAGLYANWQTTTNDQAALDELANPSFNPESTVLVSGGLQTLDSTTTNQTPGEVTFHSYAPKEIVLDASVKSPSVLLLNDRFDPNWKVMVDGKAETLLRCNYIMRGVYLTPGSHKVEFKFIQGMGTFYISLSAMILGALLIVALVLFPTPPAAEQETPSTSYSNQRPLATRR